LREFYARRAIIISYIGRPGRIVGFEKANLRMIGFRRRQFHAGKRRGNGNGPAELPGSGDEDALRIRQTKQRKDHRDPSSYRRWVADRAISWPQI
jgi:hypothetical protein